MTSLRRPALAGALLALAFATPAYAAADPRVVAQGLSNPRGMAFGGSGTLYVAEAGRGGDGACLTGPEGTEQCYGATGAITGVDVRSGRQRTLVGDLPSLAAQEGEAPGADATGPNDVTIVRDRAYFVVGLGANPAARSQLGAVGSGFASVYRYARSSGLRQVADLGAYEAAQNPDDGEIDSNPYSLDAYLSNTRLAVTDAGGNDLLSVSGSGRIQTAAVFPGGTAPAPPGIPGLPAGTPIPYEAVPTGVTRARNGSLLVGQLTGFPFPAGGANVFTVPAGGGAPSPGLSGFSVIVDVAAGRRGSVWVLQVASGSIAGPPTDGRLFRVDRDGTRTEFAAGALQQPTGLAVSPKGDAVYVANNGGSPDSATILKVPVR